MTGALHLLTAMGALIQRDLSLVLRRKNDSLATLFSLLLLQAYSH